MHPRKFGSEKVVRTYGVRPSVRPPLHVSRDEILHFKHTRVLALNRIASQTFRDKNNNSKSDSFFPLNLNVYIDMDNRERARARDKKQRRPISLEEKHENFISGEKKERRAATKVKISGSHKKSEQERIKRVTRKFLEVSRCSRAKQRRRNVQKKCAACAKLLFC